MNIESKIIATIIKAVCPLSDEVCKVIIKNSISLTVNKGTILQEINSDPHSLYVVRKGILKSYIAHKGKKRITSFYKENDLITLLQGNNLVCKDIIETIETCQLTALCLETEGYRQVMEVYYKILIHNLILQKELFIRQTITSSRQRLRSFIQENPDLLKR